MVPDKHNQQTLAELDKAAINALQQIRQAKRHVSLAVNQLDKATNRATRANNAVRRLQTKYRKTVNKEYKLNQDLKQQKSKIPSGKLLPNHYQTLGLNKNATPEKIQKRVIQVMGDMSVKNGGMAERKRGRIQAAVLTLTNPEKKSAYDKTLQDIRRAVAMAAQSKRLHKQVQRMKNRLDSAQRLARSAQEALPPLKRDLEAARKAAKQIQQTAGNKIKEIMELKNQMESSVAQIQKPSERERRDVGRNRYDAHNPAGFMAKNSAQSRHTNAEPREPEVRSTVGIKNRR